MICKFFNTGKSKSSASKQINYLINERVENGTAKVVVGNTDLTLKIINEIDNVWKFNAGVMSFEEHINTKQRDEIIAKFRETFFPGLKENQYNLLIVEHKDKDRSELHFVIPRIELTTQKAYNAFFHTRDFKKKDLFQDYINAKYNLTSPFQEEKQEIFKINTSKDKDEIKVFVDQFIKDKVEQGTITNAAELKIALMELGFTISRHGKDYIGLEIEDKKLRMKGAVYGKNFRGLEEVAEQQKIIQSKHIPTNDREFKKLEQRLNETINYQAKTNREKYARSRGIHSVINSLKHSDIQSNEQVASTREDEIPNRTGQISNSREEKHIQSSRHTKQSIHTNRRIEDDSIRAAAARRAREQREYEYRAYQEARRARIKLLEDITRTHQRQQAVKRGFINKIRRFGNKIAEFGRSITKYINEKFIEMLEKLEISNFKAELKDKNVFQLLSIKDELKKDTENPLFSSKKEVWKEVYQKVSKEFAKQQEQYKKDNPVITREELRKANHTKNKSNSYERERL